MERIRHHLNDALLMDYAAGNLPEAYSVVVASHISLCDECRSRLGAYEAVGGATLEHCDTVEMQADGLSAALARARAGGDDRGKQPITSRRRAGGLPVPISNYVGGSVEGVAWRSVGGGVRQLKLDTSGPGTVRLLYIPAGQAVPDHGHSGIEVTMVLSGAYRDETDRFGPGDVEIAGAELEHKPVAEAGRPCICIAATDARLRFRGLLPRILGPMMGI